MEEVMKQKNRIFSFYGLSQILRGNCLGLLRLCVSIFLVFITAWYLHAAEPGLPFTEDFTNTNLKDEIKTNATWSLGEEEVYLAWRKVVYGAMSDPVTWDIGPGDYTRDIAIGDMDGDGDLDVVVGHTWSCKLYINNGSIVPFIPITTMDIGTTHSCYIQAIALGDMDSDGDLDVVVGKCDTNILYLNNGTISPFEGVTGSNFGSFTYSAMDLALGDVDGDGDLDVVAGMGYGVWTGSLPTLDTNRLYLNNGTAAPFEGVSDTDIGTDRDETWSVALGDVNGDGHLDVVTGNLLQSPSNEANKLYLNNGTPDPFAGVTATEVGSDPEETLSVALGDLDNDGDLDLVTGNSTNKKVFINDGTAIPFIGITGTILESEPYWTQVLDIELCDMNGDGYLDVVAGYDELHELWLNNGTTIPFEGVPPIFIGTDLDYTMAIAVGDVDGDGDQDLVSGNLSDYETNKLYLNNGTFSPFYNVEGTEIGIDTISDSTSAIAFGDVDKDGDLDIVTGNYNNFNRLYLNNGTQMPFNGVAGTEIGSETDPTQDIVLGDVDGDGDLDVVVGNYNTLNKLYLNNGTSTPFSGATAFDIGLDTNDTRSIALGDVDNDGDLDVVAGNRGYNPFETNKLYLNNGTDTPFSGVTGVEISTELYPTAAIALSDIDDDGDLDVVTGSGAGYGYQNRFYVNNGTSTPFSNVFGASIICSGGRLTSTNDIALVDIDRDGDRDFIAGEEIIGLYFNNGTSTPFDEANCSYADIGQDSAWIGGIALGDVDSDGDLDVVAAKGGYQAGYYNKVYLNNGTSSPFQNIIGTNIGTEPEETLCITLGDVDGDGDLDVAFGNQSGLTNKLYLGNMPPTVFHGMSETQLSTDLDSTHSVAVGDVNRDGHLDVIAGNSGLNKLYLSNGTRSPFYEVIGSAIGVDEDNTYSIAIGDINRDGSLDLIVGNNSQINKLYLGNGDGTFLAGTGIGSDTDETHDIEIGDINRDGRLDVIAGNYNSPTRLYLNDGDGNPFDPASSSSIDVGATCDTALGDVDKDGDLDVVLANHGANKLYLNNDNGTFAVGTAIGSDMDNTRAIVLADINNDGWLDVVAGNEYQTNKLYWNTGSGTFFETTTSGIAIGSDADNTWSISLTDMDRDGDLDVVVGNSDNTVSNKVYWNNNGTFSESTDIGPAEYYTKDVSINDIDGDGLMEVVTANGDNANNMLYAIRSFYNTVHGAVFSKEVDTEDINNIANATLTAIDSLPMNTHIEYFLSNNGGERFFQVYSGKEFVFPTQGNDLRWRAELHSLSPALTPRIDQISITTRNIAPQATAGGTLTYTEDDSPTPIDPSMPGH
jgi:hypothetical protein